MEDLGQDAQLFGGGEGSGPGMMGTSMPCARHCPMNPKYRSLSKNIWVVMIYAAPWSTFCLSQRRSLSGLRPSAFFRVAGHADAEVCGGGVFQVGIEDALVQIDATVDQVDGGARPSASGLNRPSLRMASSWRARILRTPTKSRSMRAFSGFLNREAAADYGVLCFNLVPVHEGGADAHRARALADCPLLQQAGADLAVDVFLPVVGHVDKGGD